MSKASRGSADNARRERVAEMQRAQRAAETRRRLLFVGALVVVLVIIGVGVFVGLKNKDSSSDDAASDTNLSDTNQIVPAAVTGQTTVETKPTEVDNPTDIQGVIAYDTAGYPGPGTPSSGTLSHDHVPGPVTYAVTPPVGGPHNAIWMNAGVYTEPVPSERAVHNLEHGAVWITYRPDLPADQVAQLVSFFNQQSMIPEAQDDGRSNRFVDLTPWGGDDLPSPIVISSWGYQLQVDSPTDPRLQQFVDTFRHSQTYSPEYGSPVDGIPSQTGGQPAIDGSSKPEPTGSAE